MNNFGVIEVASERRTFAPGWAYVPDVPASIGIGGGGSGGGGSLTTGGFGAGAHEGAGGSAVAAVATVTKGGRKRALRHQSGSALSSFSDLTARQEAKMRKELELLDRDNGPVATGGGSGRDAGIAIPVKAVKAANRHTANVRRILTSQKTFANHLDDFHALRESGTGANHDTDASAAAAAAVLSSTRGGGHSHSPHRDDTPATASSGGKTARGRGSKAKAAAAASAAAATSASSSPAAASPAPGKRLTKREQRQQNAAAAAAASRAARAARADRSSLSSRSAAAAAATASGKGTASEAAPEAVVAEDTPMADAPPPPTQDLPVKQEEGAAAADAAMTSEAEAQAGAAPPPPLPPLHVSSILAPYTGPRPAPHPLDNDPLLVSYVPPVPEDDELRALLAVPPLTYTEAQATWSAGPDGVLTKRYPPRVFCEICGYWGRVKCTKCGTPVCALDCLETHREDCITRYGL